MKVTTKRVLLCMWIFGASLFITKLWTDHPSILPELPIAFSERLAEIYGARNAEDVADLEILLGLVFFIPVVSIVSLAIFLAWHSVCEKRCSVKAEE